MTAYNENHAFVGRPYQLVALDFDNTISAMMLGQENPSCPTPIEEVSEFEFGGWERVRALRQLFLDLRQSKTNFFIVSFGFKRRLEVALRNVGLLEFFPQQNIVAKDTPELQQFNYRKAAVIRSRMAQHGISGDASLFVDDCWSNLEDAKGICMTFCPQSKTDGLSLQEIQGLIDTCVAPVLQLGSPSRTKSMSPKRTVSPTPSVVFPPMSPVSKAAVFSIYAQRHVHASRQSPLRSMTRRSGPECLLPAWRQPGHSGAVSPPPPATLFTSVVLASVDRSRSPSPLPTIVPQYVPSNSPLRTFRHSCPVRLTASSSRPPSVACIPSQPSGGEATAAAAAAVAAPCAGSGSGSGSVLLRQHPRRVVGGGSGSAGGFVRAEQNGNAAAAPSPTQVAPVVFRRSNGCAKPLPLAQFSCFSALQDAQTQGRTDAPRTEGSPRIVRKTHKVIPLEQQLRTAVERAHVWCTSIEQSASYAMAPTSSDAEKVVASSPNLGQDEQESGPSAAHLAPGIASLRANASHLKQQLDACRAASKISSQTATGVSLTSTDATKLRQFGRNKCGQALRERSYQLIIFDFDYTLTTAMLSQETPSFQKNMDEVSDIEFGGPLRVQMLRRMFSLFNNLGVLFYIVSFGLSQRVKASLEKVGLLKFFDDGSIFCLDSTELQQSLIKDVLVKLLQETNAVSSHFTLFIDDSPRNMQAARGICESYCPENASDGLSVFEIQRVMECLSSCTRIAASMSPSRAMTPLRCLVSPLERALMECPFYFPPAHFNFSSYAVLWQTFGIPGSTWLPWLCSNGIMRPLLFDLAANVATASSHQLLRARSPIH